MYNITGRNIKWFVLLLSATMLFSSCDRDLDLPEVEGKKGIALLGELVAEDSFYLRAGQSIPMAAGSELQFQVLKNLAITVSDEAGGSYALNGAEDDETVRLYTIPFRANQKVLPGHTYSIRAVHPSLPAATAKVEIPGPFTASILDTASVLYSTEPVLKVTLHINDPAATSNYYVIEALEQRLQVSEPYFYYNGQWLSTTTENDLYNQLLLQGIFPEIKYDTIYRQSYIRQMLYTDDERTDNVIEKGKFNRNRRVLLKDNTFNGGVYTTQVYIRADTSVVGTLQQGRVQLTVKSVPEKYYRFLKAYEQFTGAGGFSTFSQPIKVEGNVTNGVGMVGGAYMLRFPLFYRRLF